MMSPNVSNIPDGWSEVSLSEVVASLDAGVSVNSYDRPALADEIGVLKTSAVTYGVFDAAANKTVVAGEASRVRVNPKKDRIIISRMNTLQLVGASAYVDQDYPNLYLPDRLWQLEPVDGVVHMRWLSSVLASPETRSRICAEATGTSGSMKNVAQDRLLSVRISLPPLPEQRRIAEILGTWDEAIALVEQRLAAARARKQGLMQRLLTGQVRFPGFVQAQEMKRGRFYGIPADWSWARVGDVAKQVSRKNGKGADLPVLSCTKYDGLVDSLSYFGRQVFSDDTSGYKVVRRGEFAYATNHIEEGSIGLQELYDAALISPMYTVFSVRSSVNVHYLYALLKTELYRHVFEVNTSGTVNRRGALRWDAFALIALPLPSLDEQHMIARVLREQDGEVEIIEAKLVALQMQKKGLMQRLLTGRVRVSV